MKQEDTITVIGLVQALAAGEPETVNSLRNHFDKMPKAVREKACEALQDLARLARKMDHWDTTPRNQYTFKALRAYKERKHKEYIERNRSNAVDWAEQERMRKYIETVKTGDTIQVLLDDHNDRWGTKKKKVTKIKVLEVRDRSWKLKLNVRWCCRRTDEPEFIKKSNLVGDAKNQRYQKPAYWLVIPSHFRPFKKTLIDQYLADDETVVDDGEE